MRVLVTGASGFSGSQIALEIAARGYEVFALIGSRRGRLPDPVPANVTVLQGDLAAEPALPDHVDAIVHAAASSPAPGTSPDLVRDNVVATRRLIDYAKRAGARKMIFLSSLSVHGAINADRVDETTGFAEPDEYGRTKRAGEELLGAERALASIAIRLPGVIGRGSVRNWLTQVMEAARQGRAIRLFNPYAPFNNAVHVADLGRFVLGLLQRDWRGFDALPIGAAGMTTAMKAVTLLVDAFGARSRIEVDPAPRRGFTISSERAIARYGYAPMEITAMLARFAEENRRP
jgi:nucleoside-diphosphate-sugar epimerase